MNFLVVLVFSLILFASQVMVTALVAYILLKINVDIQLVHAFVWYGISFLVAFVVFFVLALRSLRKPYVHALLIYIIVALLSFLSESVILGQPFFWPIFLVNFALTAIAIFLGTRLGRLKQQKELIH